MTSKILYIHFIISLSIQTINYIIHLSMQLSDKDIVNNFKEISTSLCAIIIYASSYEKNYTAYIILLRLTSLNILDDILVLPKQLFFHIESNVNMFFFRNINLK